MDYADVLFERIEHLVRRRTENPTRETPPVELRREAELCLATIDALLASGESLEGRNDAGWIAESAAATVEGLTLGASWAMALQQAIAATAPGVGLRKHLQPLRELERLAVARAEEWRTIVDAPSATLWLETKAKRRE